MKGKWLYEKSFPIVVFLIPLAILFGGFQIWLPPELRNQKPTREQMIIGLGITVFGWFALIWIFSFIWALLMRLLFGRDQVTRWLNETQYDFGWFNGLERFYRAACALALR